MINKSRLDLREKHKDAAAGQCGSECIIGAASMPSSTSRANFALNSAVL